MKELVYPLFLLVSIIFIGGCVEQPGTGPSQDKLACWSGAQTACYNSVNITVDPGMFYDSATDQVLNLTITNTGKIPISSFLVTTTYSRYFIEKSLVPDESLENFNASFVTANKFEGGGTGTTEIKIIPIINYTINYNSKNTICEAHCDYQAKIINSTT